MQAAASWPIELAGALVQVMADCFIDLTKTQKASESSQSVSQSDS